MTLTLRGRLETRLFLTLAVALPWVLLLTLLVRPDDLTGALRTAVGMVGLMGALGLGWELIYHGLQQLRWDRDWPSLLALAAIAVEIGPLWWVSDRAVDRPAADFFLLSMLSAWLVMWAFAQGPMRVLFLRWRLTGGRLSCGH